MMPIVAILILAGVAGSAYAFSRAPRAPSMGRVGRFAGRLRKGEFYRVWARVSPAYVDHLVKGVGADEAQREAQQKLTRDIERMGFERTKLATQDPSDKQIWTFLTYWGSPDAEVFDSDIIKLYQLQSVQEPVTSGQERVSVSGLDRGMSRDLFDAVRWSLARENDPKRLEGFARTLDCDYPVSAGLVRAKAKLESLSRTTNRFTNDMLVSGASHPMLDAFAPLRDASEGMGHENAAMWRKYEKLEGIRGWRAPVATNYEFAEKLIVGLEKRYSRDEIQDGFGKTVGAVSQEPQLLRMSASGLAKELDVPLAITAVGLMALRPIGNGVVTVDPVIGARVLPEGPRPVSHSALRVAHAVLRPEGSQIASPRAIARRLHTLNGQVSAGLRDAKKAETSLDRAKRVLERQNWIEWYRRSKTSGIMQ